MMYVCMRVCSHFHTIYCVRVPNRKTKQPHNKKQHNLGPTLFYNHMLVCGCVCGCEKELTSRIMLLRNREVHGSELYPEYWLS